MATVEYDTKSKNITQIEGKPRTISGKEPFFPALCYTLHALTHLLPVGAISGLPRLEGKLLTRHGVFVSSNSIADTPAGNILAGTVVVDNTTPLSVLQDLCSSPRLILDVTRLDLSCLPPHVKCGLRSTAKTFDVPLLKTAGDIYASWVESFSAPLLQTSGFIYVHSAISFSVPMLQTSGNIGADSATSFSAPLLQTSGYINANSAKSFSIPMLKTAGNIYANSATSFSVPLLQTAGNIDVGSATSFSVPMLQTAERIGAYSAISFSAPLLQTSGRIHADSAKSFSTPLPQTAGDVSNQSETPGMR